MKSLRAKFIKDIAIRDLAQRTRQSYTSLVVDLVRFSKQSPDTLSFDQVTDWILHLIKERQVFFKNLQPEGLKSEETERGLSSPPPFLFSPLSNVLKIHPSTLAIPHPRVPEMWESGRAWSYSRYSYHQ